MGLSLFPVTGIEVICSRSLRAAKKRTQHLRFLGAGPMDTTNQGLVWALKSATAKQELRLLRRYLACLYDLHYKRAFFLLIIFVPGMLYFSASYNCVTILATAGILTLPSSLGTVVDCINIFRRRDASESDIRYHGFSSEDPVNLAVDTLQAL